MSRPGNSFPFLSFPPGTNGNERKKPARLLDFPFRSHSFPKVARNEETRINARSLSFPFVPLLREREDPERKRSWSLSAVREANSAGRENHAGRAMTAAAVHVVATAVARGWHVDRAPDGRLRLIHPNAAVILFGVREP